MSQISHFKKIKVSSKEDAADMIKKMYSRVLEGVLLIFFDGAGPLMTPTGVYGGVGVSVCYADNGGRKFMEHGCNYNCPSMTSIMAEMLAFRDALSIANDLYDPEVHTKCVVIGDNEYALYSPFQRGPVKPHLAALQIEIKSLLFEGLELYHVPRELNKISDEISKKAKKDTDHTISLSI